jgi:ATP-dependent Clp endopeptidase proteolytic subunit ClpP
MEAYYNDSKGTGEQLYILEENNEIHFNGPVNHISMSNLVRELKKLEAKTTKESKKLKRKLEEVLKDDKDYHESEPVHNDINITHKPIKLYISSYGGSVYQVLGAYDSIKQMKVPVHTICKGFVASAGTILSLAGSKRFIMKNSYMLIHELRSAMWGKFQEIRDDFTNCQTLMDHLKKIYVENTKLTAEELDDILKHDISWNAEICLEKGLVDEII